VLIETAELDSRARVAEGERRERVASISSEDPNNHQGVKARGRCEGLQVNRTLRFVEMGQPAELSRSVSIRTHIFRDFLIQGRSLEKLFLRKSELIGMARKSHPIAFNAVTLERSGSITLANDQLDARGD
jgi:hypothetical protein